MESLLGKLSRDSSIERETDNVGSVGGEHGFLVAATLSLTIVRP